MWLLRKGVVKEGGLCCREGVESKRVVIKVTGYWLAYETEVSGGSNQSDM